MVKDYASPLMIRKNPSDSSNQNLSETNYILFERGLNDKNNLVDPKIKMLKLIKQSQYGFAAVVKGEILE